MRMLQVMPATLDEFLVERGATRALAHDDVLVRFERAWTASNPRQRDRAVHEALTRMSVAPAPGSDNPATREKEHPMADNWKCDKCGWTGSGLLGTECPEDPNGRHEAHLVPQEDTE